MNESRPILIVGGAGFIGTNLAARLAAEGRQVRIFDDMSRRGARSNAAWLAATYRHAVDIRIGDLRDIGALANAVSGCGHVFHFAAQVAVTTSLVDPVHDFDVNLRGTLNLLEVLRRQARPIPLLFTSTNKVYGALDDLPLIDVDERWEPRDPALRARGIGEDRPLCFYSPYGCSKGAADQYVLDYARSYDLPATVFRMSCIYGPHQHGTEDQGWVAHFMLRALRGQELTIFGDGKQVRDLLFVDDLVDAFLAAAEATDEVAGRAFNIGGTPANSASLLQVIRTLDCDPASLRFEPPRLGDQRYYASDVSAFSSITGWRPRVGVAEGLQRLRSWFLEDGTDLRASAPLLANAEQRA